MSEAVEPSLMGRVQMRACLQRLAIAFVFYFTPITLLHAQSVITIDGSTGVAPLVAALGKAYEQQNPGTQIQIGKGLGTGARIRALDEGKIDIAMASHGLDVAAIQKRGMTVHEFAKVAVVFAVNETVPAGALTDAQVCAIYSGKAVNWKDLGGPDLAIAPLARPDSEVDTEVVRDKVACLAQMKFPDSVRLMPKAGEMAQGLAATPGGVGMTTMTVVEQSSGKVKAVSLNGIVPTAENVQRKTYVLTRDSFLVVKDQATEPVTRFLAFIRSPAGQKVIAANGAVAVK
jgi:phosphate transport system substrate-binding protein